MNKIAFCFLIYDVINHEELWNLFFKNVDINKYNIYIHYKTNKKLNYFEKYKLKNCIETKYEDQTIPLAYNVLFREAYKDENNYKFIIVSGSCIPFKSFNYIYDQIMSHNRGYFNVCPIEQCFPNCNLLLYHIPREIIGKSHNWFILNRKLVNELTFDKDELINNLYSNVYAPAEYYYYTFIKLLKLEDEIITIHNSSNDATTFTNWCDMDYKYISTYGLKNYDYISEEELLYLLNSKCLFGRKFTIKCTESLDNEIYKNRITS